MNKFHWKRSWIVPISLGTLVLLAASSYYGKRERDLAKANEPQPVLVAKGDILSGVLLNESMVTQVRVPFRFLQPGAISRLEDVVGQVSLVPIQKGEQILNTKVAPVGEKTGLATRVPPGMRAVSLSVDESTGVSGLIRPNNFVDILASFELEDALESRQNMTATLAQNVLVLAVGYDIGEVSKSQEKRKDAFGGEATPAKTVTLSLTPEQAQQVLFAQHHGELVLALRPQWDETPVDLSPTTTSTLLGVKAFAKGRGVYREYRGR